MTKPNDDIKHHVKQKYASIVSSETPSGPGSCCGDDQGFVNILEQGDRCGYTKDQLLDKLALANLGLGCGNPLDMANLKEGESVLDLGSGAGFDAFLAAQTVGVDGRVVGVDMTFEMVEKARENAEKLGIENADFRVGEIEDLPVVDGSIDAVISNCVINLSPDKPAVYREIHRVLKPGGRISISDVLRIGEIPEEIKNDIEAYTA
jgi:arsenite methyltransferase